MFSCLADGFVCMVCAFCFVFGCLADGFVCMVCAFALCLVV